MVATDSGILSIAFNRRWATVLLHNGILKSPRTITANSKIKMNFILEILLLMGYQRYKRGSLSISHQLIIDLSLGVLPGIIQWRRIKRITVTDTSQFKMSTPEDKFISFWSFTFLLIGNMIVVCGTLLLWKYFWLGSNNLLIPYSEEFPKEQKTPENQLYLYSIFETIRVIKKVITHTQPQYLIKKLGHQGYFYLLLLKRLVQIQLSLCILDLTVSLPYVLLFKTIHLQMLIRIESGGNAVFRTIYTTITSFIVVYSLYSLRTQFSKTLRYQVVKDKNDDQLVLEWLKLRTLYLQILFKHTTPETISQIRNYLQRFLNVDCETRYQIYDIIPVSDYSSLLRKLSSYWFYKTTLDEAGQEDLPALYRSLSCTNRDRINARLLQLEAQIEIQNQQQFAVVGFFLVLDSIEAIQILQNHFNLTSRIVFCRNYQLIEEIDYPFIINKISSPEDLVWENLQYSRSSIIREFFFNMLSIFVLVFISTPAAVLNWVKVPAIFTPYLVIIINSVLFYILSMFVAQQKHFRQSQKQKIQCKMLLFYMGMNMIVGSIARNIKNVTDLLQQGGWMWIEVFELVFKKIDGLYYCVLFFNQLTISLVYSLLKPLEILANYGWVNLCISKSKLSQRLFHSENYNFPYAYNYCLVITLFVISVIYSLSIPWIHFFALLFFVGKQYSDTYTLLTFHKKEFQSMGDLIASIIFYTSFASVVHLFLVANSLLVEQQYFNAIFLYGTMGVVIYVCYQLKLSIRKELDLAADVPKETSNINERDLQAWRKCFEHPLVNQNSLNMFY